jgi:hypothetical protein
MYARDLLHPHIFMWVSLTLGEQDVGMDNEDKKGGRSPRKTRTEMPREGADLPSAQTQSRRPVKDRWFYEPIMEAEPALSVHPQLQDNGENGAKDTGDFAKGDEVGDKEQIYDKEPIEESFCQNLGITDQLKCLFHVNKLLSASSDLTGENTDVCVRREFLVNNNKVLFRNFTGASVVMPDSLGPVESLPEYLERLEGNEEAAWDLQGIIFHDEDMGWCTSIVTGWGTDHGTNIVFYAPVYSKDLVADEEHASLTEVLGWLMQTPVYPRISDNRPSRALKKSGDVKNLTMRQVIPVLRQRPKYGTMLASRVTGLVNNVKVQSSRTIIRILKAQEILFKYAAG